MKVIPVDRERQREKAEAGVKYYVVISSFLLSFEKYSKSNKNIIFIF